ncbi:MAG: hypothetical protein QXY18_05750 [Nitrososphaerota archaeon]
MINNKIAGIKRFVFRERLLKGENLENIVQLFLEAMGLNGLILNYFRNRRTGKGVDFIIKLSKKIKIFLECKKWDFKIMDKSHLEKQILKRFIGLSSLYRAYRVVLIEGKVVIPEDIIEEMKKYDIILVKSIGELVEVLKKIKERALRSYSFGFKLLLNKFKLLLSCLLEWKMEYIVIDGG